MNYSKIVYFKNWTTKDFTYKFDSQMQTFVAGQTYQMPLEIAQHFAKHLADRELMTSGDPKDEFLPEGKHKEFMDRCFPGGVPQVNEKIGLPIQIIDTTAAEAPKVEENTTEADVQAIVEEPEEDVKDNKPVKRGRPKKVKDEDYVVPNA